MGDRALIQLMETERYGSKAGAPRYSPALYLHWSGHEVIDILKDVCAENFSNVIDYAFARLVAKACEYNPGTSSVGVWNYEGAITTKDSHGDAGCFLVTVGIEDWIVSAFGGYGYQSVIPCPPVGAGKAVHDAWMKAAATGKAIAPLSQCIRFHKEAPSSTAKPDKPESAIAT